MKRLAIISTHPIQYNAPFFALLQARNIIQLRVFYTWGRQVLEDKYDPGFDRHIRWDIDLTNGYDHVFLENRSPAPGSHHYLGIDNPCLISEVEKYQPDAVWIFGWPFRSHLKAMRYFKGKIPVLFRGDSHMLDPLPAGKSLIRRLFLRWVYRYIDLAFYVGQSNRAYFHNLGVQEHRLRFAPHAVDNARFSPEHHAAGEEGALLRQRLGIAKSDLVFLFAGKFESKKDPLFLLSCFQTAGLPESVHLVLVGNGDLESEMKSMARDSRQVHFMDFCNQSDMPAVYALCDVFVLPSRGPGESWGLAVNEAMASGRAVLVSDRCGCALDLVEQGINGWVFPAGDSTVLAQIFHTAIQEGKAGLSRMGQASLHIIRSFSFQQIAEAVEKTMLDSSTCKKY